MLRLVEMNYEVLSKILLRGSARYKPHAFVASVTQSESELHENRRSLRFEGSDDDLA